MELLKDSTRGAGKLSTLTNIYSKLDDEFKNDIENAIHSSCLLNLLKIPKADNLVPVIETLFLFYNVKDHIFQFGEISLGVTLEDVLYITGLPISGTPVINPHSAVQNSFHNIVGLPENTIQTTTKDLKDLILDRSKDREKRMTALLTLIVFCFITPAYNGNFASTFVELVRDVNRVNEYAWGAALLAYLNRGIEKYEKKEKSSIDGNLWIVLGFFLIRIPRLREALGINLTLNNCQVPLLTSVVEEVKKISKNHRPNRYIDRVRKILLNLSDADIIWTPYDGLEATVFIQEQRTHATALTPIFCHSHVVHHKPHLVARQFPVFADYDTQRLYGWKPKKIKMKQERPHP